MADVRENLGIWQHSYDWSQRGDEWSAHWGDTRALWHGALMPRIHTFVPAATVLEIAPGHGRWTQFLKDVAEQLVIVDLAQRCIDHCQERFKEADNISYHVNDGRSLQAVEDESVDFVFSFDSLVHAEADVIDAYVREIGGKLSADGVAFIHHSNLGNYRRSAELARRAPDRWRPSLVGRGILVDIGAWRTESVTAESFAASCADAGLSCVGQETISWQHGGALIDCLSLVARPGSRWDRPHRLVRNRNFSREGARTATLYASSSFPAAKR